MSDYKHDMGNRLSQHRKNLHLTQEQAAEILDISLKHYSELERGITGVSVDVLITISNKLGISIDYLLKGTESDTSLPQDLVDLYHSFLPEQKHKLKELLHLLSVFQIKK